LGENIKTVFISVSTGTNRSIEESSPSQKYFLPLQSPKFVKKKKFPEAKNKNNKATIENRFQYRYFRLKRYMTRNLSGSVIFDVACK